MKIKSAEASKAFMRKVILPLSALVALLFLCSIGGVFWIANYQTDVSTRYEISLAESAVTMLGNQLAAGATDYGRWDEALAAATDKFNYKWLSENIGEAGEASFGAEFLFVLDAQGKTVYSRVASEDGTVPIDSVLGPSFRAWFDVWRGTPAYSVLAKTIPLGKDAAVFAIAPLRPFELSDKSPPTWYSLVFVDVIDDAKLQRLRDDFHLHGLRLVHTANDITDEQAVISIPAADGATALRLAWNPKRPGDDLVKVALPFLMVFMTVVAVLGAVVIRHVIQSAQLISDREKRAFCDALTGLGNRSRFFAELERAMERIVPNTTGVVVMYIDLDGFKTINDSMGHSAGDELLVLAAHRFRSCVRDSDLVARLGGDEFAILISGNVDRSYVQSVGTRILLAISEPFELMIGTAVIGCSIGVAECRERTEDCTELLNRADKALYHVKASGKNALRFADDESDRTGKLMAA